MDPRGDKHEPSSPSVAEHILVSVSIGSSKAKHNETAPSCGKPLLTRSHDHIDPMVVPNCSTLIHTKLYVKTLALLLDLLSYDLSARRPQSPPSAKLSAVTCIQRLSSPLKLV